MCLPYAIAQAESMSNIVLDVTPNLIFIIDDEMRIRECNRMAQQYLGVSREEALERYIFEFIETEDIEMVLETKQSIMSKKVDLPQIHLKAEEKNCVYSESYISACHLSGYHERGEGEGKAVPFKDGDDRCCTEGY